MPNKKPSVEATYGDISAVDVSAAGISLSVSA